MRYFPGRMESTAKPPETMNGESTVIRPFFRFESNENLTDLYLEEKARKELHEDPTKTAQEIQCLRDALAKEINLTLDTSDEFLLRYLRARKFNQEKTLKLIQRYYRLKKDIPSMYQDLIPSKCADRLEATPFTALPYPDKEGRAMMLFSFDKWDVEKFPTAEHILHLMILCLETALEEKCFQICGVNLLLDAEGLGIQHWMRISPRAAYRGISMVQNGEPLRLKGVYVVNEGQLFDILFQIAKPFMGQKLRSRFHFLGKDLKALHEHFSVDILPSELGGSLNGEEIRKEWSQYILQKDDIFKKRDSYGYKT